MNKELVNKIIDLELINNKKESEVYIDYLYEKIKHYEKQMKYLKSNKPFWFQKIKLEKYNNKLEEYEKKIKETYIKLEEELN